MFREKIENARLIRHFIFFDCSNRISLVEVIMRVQPALSTTAVRRRWKKPVLPFQASPPSVNLATYRAARLEMRLQKEMQVPRFKKLQKKPWLRQ